MVHDVAVSIPRLSAAIKHLNHPHSTFDHATSNQAAIGKLTAAIILASRFGFTSDIKRFLSFGLHPIRDFQRLYASFQLSILRTLFQMLLIHLLHQIQQATLR